MFKFVEFHQNGELVLFNTAQIVEVYSDQYGTTALVLTNGTCKIDESYTTVRKQLTD